VVRYFRWIASCSGREPFEPLCRRGKAQALGRGVEAAGAKIGRTDPAKDPKGALTVELLKKADQPEVAKSVLEHSTVLPEEALVKKIQMGALDVGFFYSVETTDAGLTAIDLPAGITPKAIYTLTILQNAPNPSGAQNFVSFVLGAKGSALLKEHGLALTHPQLTGPDTAVPQAIPLLGKWKSGQIRQSEAAAIRRAEGMSRDPANAGRSHSSVQAIRTLASFRTRSYWRSLAVCRKIWVSCDHGLTAASCDRHFHQRHGNKLPHFQAPGRSE
jgi:Bacterial extracellular solute-binding protein